MNSGVPEETSIIVCQKLEGLSNSFHVMKM